MLEALRSIMLSELLNESLASVCMNKVSWAEIFFNA